MVSKKLLFFKKIIIKYENERSRKIITRYKQGERKFSNIKCNGDFTSSDLSEADFSGSELDFSKFDGCILLGCNFSDCSMKWCGFENANLTGANLTNADLRWCNLNNAILHKAVLRKTNFNWSLMFNVNIHEAVDIKDARFENAAFSPESITKEGLESVHFQLSKMKDRIPYDRWIKLHFEVVVNAEKAGRMEIQKERPYNASFSSSYGVIKGDQEKIIYLNKTFYGKSTAYSKSSVPKAYDFK